MSWPTPAAGQIVRYAYLWRSEASSGLEEGLKDRPCMVIGVHRLPSGRPRVVVAPISHSQPKEADASVEIPRVTQRRLGLDSERQWIVLSELNSFLWPGPDLRPARNTSLESVVIGVAPAALYAMVKERLRVRLAARAVAITIRSE